MKLYDSLDTFLTQSSALNLMPSSIPTAANLETAIADTGSRGINIFQRRTLKKNHPSDSTIQVGTASGQHQTSSATCDLDF